MKENEKIQSDIDLREFCEKYVMIEDKDGVRHKLEKETIDRMLRYLEIFDNIRKNNDKNKRKRRNASRSVFVPLA